MFQQPFEHKIFRKVIVGFGTIFNNIRITDPNGKTIRVPIGYGPAEKYVQIDSGPERNIDGKVSIQQSLPKMTYEVTSFTYDEARVISPHNKLYIQNEDNEVDYQYQPVPYDIGISLYIKAGDLNELYAITEQVLPFFSPTLTITLKDIPELDTRTDIPIVLQSVDQEDDWDGGFTELRSCTMTLTFIAKALVHGPVRDSKIIKKVDANIFTDKTLNELLERINVDVDPETAGPDDPHTILITYDGAN